MANGVNGNGNSNGALDKLAAQAAAGPQPVRTMVIHLLDDGNVAVEGKNLDENSSVYMLHMAHAALYQLFQQQRAQQAQPGSRLLIARPN